jgi:eukaryotic-like serine/threonine-protein kinase
MTAPASLAEALAGRYRLEHQIGRGGMAIVYLAHDLRHDRPVALKVLRSELAAALGPERFLREIRLTARLDHPHILPVLDSGQDRGALWYTMPFVRGETLRDLIRREPQLPLDLALELAHQIAGALDHAHRGGVVHRDLKPENILLSEGQARVADFGVARALDAAGGERITETGLVLGTPAYMSPEQAVGDSAIDGRSDQYSLGCVLYEMLAGEPPFSGPTAQAVIARRMTGEIPAVRRLRPAVPSAVEDVISRALAPIPANRFPSVGELARALQSAAIDRAPSGRWRRVVAGAVARVIHWWAGGGRS